MKTISPRLVETVVTTLSLPSGDLAQNDAAGRACDFNRSLSETVENTKTQTGEVYTLVKAVPKSSSRIEI